MSQVALELLSKIQPPEERSKKWEDVLIGMFQTETTHLNMVISEKPVNVLPNLKGAYTDDELVELFKSIPVVEAEIDRQKKLSKQCEAERKNYTDPLNKVCSRLMTSEKEFANYAKDLTDGILTVKRLKDDFDKRKQKRAQELIDHKLSCQKRFNNDVASQETLIAKEITKAYNYALDNLKEEDLSEYLSVLKDNLIENYTQRISFAEHKGDTEKQSIFDGIFSDWSAKEEMLEAKIIEDVGNTFDGFEFALKQKEDAKRIQKEKDERLAEEIKQDLEIAQASAHLGAMAVTMPERVEEKTKALKVFYTIDMNHDEVGMQTIIRAYFSNLSKVAGMFSKSDLWDLSINDMAKMLCKVKEKDSAFDVLGIVFKEDTKLGR